MRKPHFTNIVLAPAVLRVMVTFLVTVLFVVTGNRSDTATAAEPLLGGAAAFGGFQKDAPGVRRRITPADLPPPYATGSVGNGPEMVERPWGAAPRVPPGFVVSEFFAGLDEPREVRVSPNGDIFIAESRPGRIRVMRAADGADKPARVEIFASGLDRPFGIGFFPPGNNPQYIYIANTGSVVRFPYRNGDLKARGPAQKIAEIPADGMHWTRDLVFSNDGAKMFVSVGSSSNDGEDMDRKSDADAAEYDKTHALGASWEAEERRADVLQFNPDGSGLRIFATGIRNCVGMAISPATGQLWCSTNERDELGDNLPPDYLTSVRDGGFYGWPWFYIGDHQDPRRRGERADLRGKITVPDVLIQAHSASLEMVFYQGLQFPHDYRGDIFAAEHGSWNRSLRTGYKVIRVIMHDGKPTGEYDDFMTGFVTPDGRVWGRPVGVAVVHDGSLLVTEDGHGTVWRVSYPGGKD